MADGKGVTFASNLLKLIFNATAIANIADNAASSPLTNLYAALHTADPTNAGAQNTSEISYTGYARVAILRTTGGWTVTAASASPVSAVSFGAMTAGAGGTAGWVSIGTLASGAGQILYVGTISPAIVVNTGVTPILSSASTVIEI